MSANVFKKAYANSDLVRLRKYIKLDKTLSTKKFMNYVESSFTLNREVYGILVLILFNQYDLDKVVADVIDRDNVDLLENILSNDYSVELDEKLILKTLQRGRVSMAKAIYEYIYDVKKNSYRVICRLLRNYEFVYNKNDDSIDSFVLAIHIGHMYHIEHAIEIMSKIDLNFWNTFMIKYATVRGHIGVVQRLLLYNAIGDDIPFKIAIKNEKYDIANELLKHYIVRTDNINIKFVKYLIKNNCLCSVEKILNNENKNIKSIFSDKEIINLIIESHNDITYLVINMGLIDLSEIKTAGYYYSENEQLLCKSDLIDEIKLHLKDYKIIKPYSEKPYELNLDPLQIYKKAMMENNIDLAKSIKNYPISISSVWLLEYINSYGNISHSCDSDELVTVEDYVRDKFEEYNLTELFLANESYNIADDILDKLESELNHEHIYNYSKYNCVKEHMYDYIKENYDEEEYKEFYETNIGKWPDISSMDSNSEDDNS
jgi:hypothetical protein